MISYRQELLRKGIHLSSLVYAALILIFRDRMPALSGAFALLCVMVLFVEHGVANRVPYITPAYRALFGRMLRRPLDPNAWAVSGAAPVYAAAALSCFLFPPCIAATALAVMLTADTAAALVGRKIRLAELPGGKSLGGFLGFLLTGLVTIGAMYIISMELVKLDAWFLFYGAAGVLLAALAELFEKQLHVDDNFSIVLVVGCALLAGCWLNGGVNEAVCSLGDSGLMSVWRILM